MAIANSKDLTHIVRTTQQWTSSYDAYENIPEGVLCIEFTPSGEAKAKIGNGREIFSKLPYIGGAELTNYYTKQETVNCVQDILKTQKVIRIKGILDNKDRLPSNATCGDLYFVISQNQSSSNKYDEYVYSPNNTWETLGSIPIDIDLSEYAKIVYVDQKIEEVNERIDDIEQHGTHTHANKDILDLITAAFTAEEKDKLSTLYNYDDTELRELITQASHTHSNKEILDAISAPFTREDKSKLDQLNPYDDSVLKEKIQALERLAHEHSNKRILDRTTASFTTEYERKIRWIRMYTGCTGMEEGIAGLVPAAQAGEEDYVLSGSGEWVPQTGGGGTYTLPIATASTLGGIKVGDGLSIESDGTLSVVGGSGGGNYAAGDAIEIDTSSFNVDAIRWDISDIKDPIQSSSGNGPWVQARYIQFRDNSNNNILIDSGSGIWSDDTAVSYYQDLTLDNMIANTQKMCASWRSPDLTMKLTFLLDSPVAVSSVAKFRILLGDDVPGRDPKAWSIYVRNATTQEWHLVHTVTDAQLSDTRSVWTDDFLLENPNRSTINVKYGNGLTVNASNELEVDFDLPVATDSTLGGVIIDEGLSIDEDGHVSAKVYEAGQGITFDEAAPEGQFKVRNLEYYFDNQISCQIDGNYGPRTFTRVSQYEQCLAVIWPRTLSGQGWANPLFVGLTENSVKLTNSADSNILGPSGSFTYKGYTWYYTCTYGLMNSSGVDLLGDLQTMNYTDSTDEVDGSKHLIDLANLVMYEESIDVWDGGTAWLNGAYNDGQSDQFWTNRYYTYHSDQNAYLEVPAGAIKMRLIGISNENDSRLQGGGVDCFNSSHHHFATVGCITDEWADIPDGTVYLQFGVKWNELNNRTISSSDIKSVTLEFYYDTPRHDTINAKLGNGLEFDSNDAIKAKLGNGLGFDANGAIEVTGGGGGDSIDEGAGIEITTDPLTDVKTISINYGTGLSVDPITNELFVDGQLPEGTIIKKLTYVGDGSTTNSNIHFDKKPLSILSLNGLVGQNYGSVISTPIDAPYLHGVWGGASGSGASFRSSMSYDDSTNTLSITNTSDVGLAFNISGETYQMFYLTKGHSGGGTSATNEVSVVKTFSYTGTGTATNDIQFPETPDMILNIHGPLGANGDIITSPMDIKHPTTTSQYTLTYTYQGSGLVHMGSYSFNDTTNVLTLSGNDYGACLNYNGYTYYVDYIVNEVIPSTMPYEAGEAISIETIGGLQLTNYSNNDFVDSIASMNGGTIVKAADKSYFTLTATMDDCYTRGTSAQSNGSYPYNVNTSTKYRFAWDSADPTVHGNVYIFENGSYDAGLMHEIDQYDTSYIEFTTSANTTFFQVRFGVMYNGDSITYSNVRLYEVIDESDRYNEISVKYGDGLTVNERNELEVNYGNGLEIVSNSQYRPEYYFNTQVRCQVHTDTYYPTSAPFDRTYQKTTTDPALCCIWEVYDSGYLWTGPLLVGTTAASVQYTTADTQQTVTYQNTFQYLGQTWYTSGYPDFINAADHEDKLGYLQYLGSYASVSDQIQAAKDLIDLALINAGSLQAKLGSGLSFDANGAIQVTGGGGGGGDTVAQGNGISITTDQQTGVKTIAVNAGSGLQINQTTHELESTGVSSISATPNTPGSITITNGSTSTPLSVISQMGGAGASTAGSAGYVPSPAAGDNDAYLRGDGVWDDDVLTENDNFTITFVPDDYQPT